MSIQKHRGAIDKIDAQIVKLLNRRTKHVLGIGQAKLASGKAIYQPDREQALLRRICKVSDGVLPDESLRHIYREVMSASIALQQGFKIAFLGPESTYTHQAAVRRFGTSLAYVPQKTIAEVFSEGGKKSSLVRCRPRGEYHRRCRYPHARYVRGQRTENRRPDRYTHRALPRG